MTAPRSSTDTLIAALMILSRDIETEDGVVINFSVLQFPSLLTRRVGVSFIACGGSVRWSEEFGLFYQPAEFLFADRLMRSLFGGQARGGLVFHFQPLQPHDAKIFLALLPNLSLSQLDGLLHA